MNSEQNNFSIAHSLKNSLLPSIKKLPLLIGLLILLTLTISSYTYLFFSITKITNNSIIILSTQIISTILLIVVTQFLKLTYQKSTISNPQNLTFAQTLKSILIELKTSLPLLISLVISAAATFAYTQFYKLDLSELNLTTITNDNILLSIILIPILFGLIFSFISKLNYFFSNYLLIQNNNLKDSLLESKFTLQTLKSKLFLQISITTLLILLTLTPTYFIDYKTNSILTNSQFALTFLLTFLLINLQSNSFAQTFLQLFQPAPNQNQPTPTPLPIVIPPIPTPAETPIATTEILTPAPEPTVTEIPTPEPIIAEDTIIPTPELEINISEPSLQTEPTSSPIETQSIPTEPEQTLSTEQINNDLASLNFTPIMPDLKEATNTQNNVINLPEAINIDSIDSPNETTPPNNIQL